MVLCALSCMVMQTAPALRTMRRERAPLRARRGLCDNVRHMFERLSPPLNPPPPTHNLYTTVTLLGFYTSIRHKNFCFHLFKGNEFIGRAQDTRITMNYLTCSPAYRLQREVNGGTESDLAPSFVLSMP